MIPTSDMDVHPFLSMLCCKQYPSDGSVSCQNCQTKLRTHTHALSLSLPLSLSLTSSHLLNSHIKTQFKFLNELITFICLNFFLWNITWFHFQSTCEQTPHLNTKLVTLNTAIMQESCTKCCVIFEVFTAGHICWNLMVLQPSSTD